MTLRVLEIFDSIQGEGFWTGTPMTFFRLAGCNAPGLGLACTKWCDTPDSWDPGEGYDLAVGEAILLVRQPRVCLTGGEPLVQREAVARFATEARGLGMRLHVETNGTLPPPLLVALAEDGRAFDWATVSPKPPHYQVVRAWRGHVDELKFIVDEHFDAGIAERVSADHPEALVSIQPVWGERYTEQALTAVMEHPEWRLSLQMHRFLGIR